MGRIVLAGVDSAALDILTSELEGLGHVVLEALTGQDAYEIALSEAPDMVMLEIPLPIFDAYETCRMIREDPEIPSELPVIFLVSRDVDERRLDAVGATDVLSLVHGAYEVTDLLAKHLSADAFPDSSNQNAG